MAFAEWSLLTDLVTAALTCVVLALFVGYSRRLDVDDQHGWVAVSVGFSLLLLGMLVSIALAFPGVAALFDGYGGAPRLLVERVLGSQLPAVMFLAYGFSRWMPAIRALRETEVSLQRYRDELESRVSQRTYDLALANEHLRQESQGHAQLSQELNESQRRLATLMGNLPGMAYRGHPGAERRMEFVSDGCVEVTGYPPEQLVDGDLILYGNLILETDREYVETAIQQALERGDRFHLEYRIETAHASQRQVWEQGTGVYDDAGELLAIEGLIVDITQRKVVEDRLQLASLIIDNALEGIMVTDENGVIETVNPSFTTITGFSFEEAVGNLPSMLKSGRHDADFYARIWTDVLERGSWRGEIWNRRKNGEIYPEWLTINAIRDGAGRVRRMIGIFSDITQRKMNEEHLKHLAHHDVLTALPNRLLYLDRLQQQMRRAERENQVLAVLFLDLNRFKPINDSYGHGVGDLILKQVADRLSENVRGIDTVARIGGDEFTIIIGGLDYPGDAMLVAEKIQMAFQEPFRVDSQDFDLGVSIGIAFFPKHAKDADTLTRCADVAMYHAKTGSGNKICLFEPGMEN